jgi:toxin FitB
VSGFLLDTNVISELVKPRPDARVVSWVDATAEHLLYLSVLTFGEIRKGISFLPLNSRRVALETWVDSELLYRFAGRILSIDLAVADRWGRIAGSSAARKSPIAVIDRLLVATALHHDLTLVTRNTADLVASGVPLFDPWQG